MIDVEIGAEVTRWIAGTLAHKLRVTDVTDDRVICGAWEFDRQTGCEIDDDLGWGPPPKLTGSYIQQPREINTLIIRLVQTNEDPETYDAYTRHDAKVGELALKHHRFTVHCPDSSGTLVYSCKTRGQRYLQAEERTEVLIAGVAGIVDWLKGLEPPLTSGKRMAAALREELIRRGWERERPQPDETWLEMFERLTRGGYKA